MFQRVTGATLPPVVDGQRVLNELVDVSEGRTGTQSPPDNDALDPAKEFLLAPEPGEQGVVWIARVEPNAFSCSEPERVGRGEVRSELLERGWDLPRSCSGPLSRPAQDLEQIFRHLLVLNRDLLEPSLRESPRREIGRSEQSAQLKS